MFSVVISNKTKYLLFWSVLEQYPYGELFCRNLLCGICSVFTLKEENIMILIV